MPEGLEQQQQEMFVLVSHLIEIEEIECMVTYVENAFNVLEVQFMSRFGHAKLNQTNLRLNLIKSRGLCVSSGASGLR